LFAVIPGVPQKKLQKVLHFLKSRLNFDRLVNQRAVLKEILLNERLIKDHVTEIICKIRGDEGGEKSPHYEYGP
jgi:hypothetical protein